jgi:hypothetical protein
VGGILDMNRIAQRPDHFAAMPFPDDRLQALYGTTQPTREIAEPNLEFSNELERGQGIYFVLYRDSKPADILFAGYSFD